MANQHISAKNDRITCADDAFKLADELSSECIMELDKRHNAENYHAIPFVPHKASGVFLYDNKGNKFYDYLACFGAVNQGHCHPKIVDAVQKQLGKMTICSRAFICDLLAIYAKFIGEFFGYERVLPMNSGMEGVETSVKLCRKWAYKVKGVPEPEAKIVMCSENFWGRSITAASTSQDPDNYGNYGPYTPGFIIIPYNDVAALEKVLAEDPNICAFVVEPVQGEAGVVVPDDGYLKKCYDACSKHNVLFVADEIQAGLCRTGSMIACSYDGVRPDVLVLGKALSGGMMPVSAVLADDKVLLVIRPGQHGSTYGGNPLGCAAAIAALCVLKDENLAENSVKMGKIFRDEMSALKKDCPWIVDVRGRGLMNAVQIEKDTFMKAFDICIELAKHGVLCKPTHQTTIRFTPPLVITEEEMRDSLSIIRKVFVGLGDKM